ncbi:carboxypeptidase regulatory-like domain-containing protein [Gimesia aquarii]|uniref:Carboxypeptidase regulatory-like domain-containing protein n=1 Tax=Gimesia aquarii TaxID=2527964 RepID=A0A517VYI4_9PLAN|nr:carboxypeptidase regulatory-like domain-containing protein [Gimesia aquarii]QDT98065.1 hypothetical protein V144x_35490 [Gimesia aquarii]
MKTNPFSLHLSQVYLLIVLVSLSGCMGDGSEPIPELAEVTGVITLDGKPIKAANVTFEPESAGENGRRRASSGTTEKDGTYKLQYNPNALGATLGKHKVTIMKMSDNPDEAGKHLVPPKYNDSSTSGLTAEVTQGENKFDFDLKSK